MKNDIRNAAIEGITSARTLADNKTISVEVATKIINKCEGIHVEQCIPAHVTDSGIIVYIRTTDGRSWESIFSLTGVFKRTRGFKQA